MRHKLFKLATILLAFASVLVLFGCSDTEDASNKDDSASSVDTETPSEEAIIGMTKNEAIYYLEERGYTWRVVSDDESEVPQEMTLDLYHNRHNLTIEGGVVTEVSKEEVQMSDSPKDPVAPGSIELGDDSIVGLRYSVAKEVMDIRGINYRTVWEDGESYPVTMDYVVGRYNLYVNKGTVIAIDIEGQGFMSGSDQSMLK